MISGTLICKIGVEKWIEKTGVRGSLVSEMDGLGFMKGSGWVCGLWFVDVREGCLTSGGEVV